MATRKPKKPLHEMTSEEAIRQLFPKKVIQRVKRELGTPEDHDRDGKSSSRLHPKA